MKQLTIAIDFDDTLTAAQKLWRRFVTNAMLNYGHRVIVVTARRDTEENIDLIDGWLQENEFPELSVYFTSLQSKVDYMEKRGVKVDIWIDDDPRRCALGH
jgi:5'(3')-deoxyribonucleotidase